MFYDIIKEATHATIPPMPGSSRFKGDIFNTIDRIFAKTATGSRSTIGPADYSPGRNPRQSATHRLRRRRA